MTQKNSALLWIVLITAAALLVWVVAHKSGETSYPAGVPNWIPMYPGARASNAESRKAGVETYVRFTLDAKDDCGKVIAFYDEKLTLAGFNVVKTTSRSGGCSGLIRAEGPGHTRSVNLNGGEGGNGGSTFTIEAVLRDLPGQTISDSKGEIPAWIPKYPNSTPSNVVVRQEGSERGIAFNFTTRDDARAVVSWYEQKLRDAQFTIVSSGVFDSAHAGLRSNDATGRSILNLRMEPAGSQKVVAIEAREGVQ